jgi:hypothetical protein
MKRIMCKSKIHRATVTDSNLNYEGSITIDGALLDAADIRAYEQVHVVNIANGARFETYAIRAGAGSGDVVINGAAARLIGREFESPKASGNFFERAVTLRTGRFVERLAHVGDVFLLLDATVLVRIHDADLDRCLRDFRGGRTGDEATRQGERQRDD